MAMKAPHTHVFPIPPAHEAGEYADVPCRVCGAVKTHRLWAPEGLLVRKTYRSSANTKKPTSVMGKAKK